MKKINKKDVIFDEKIDKSINGFALVSAFIVIGVILQFDNSFFGTSTKIIKITFIIVGILGLFTEIKKLNISYNIKGLDDIILGIILLIVGYSIKRHFDINNWIEPFISLYEFVLFFWILISLFGFCKGMYTMIYSIYNNYKENPKNSKFYSSILASISQLLGIALILAQIYDIFNK